MIRQEKSDIRGKLTIRTATEKDKPALMQLWKEAFDDDDAYLAYYFQNVFQRNCVFCGFLDRTLVCAIHLNPYRVMTCGSEQRLHYIVGVATKKEYRGMGIMRQVMESALEYLRKQQEPYTFLMPEKQEYYQGMGFVRYEKSVVVDLHDMCFRLSTKALTGEYRLLDCRNLTEDCWIRFNAQLSKYHDVFVTRDAEYVLELEKQCSCQGGKVYVVGDAEGICALFGTMQNENGSVQPVQYISLTGSLLPLVFVIKTEKLPVCETADFFGNSYFDKSCGVPAKRQGKGIMYKIFKNSMSNCINYDRILSINEIV